MMRAANVLLLLLAAAHGLQQPRPRLPNSAAENIPAATENLNFAKGVVVPVTQPAPKPDQPTTDSAVETLLATVNGGSNFYFNVIVTAVLVVGIHALLPFGTLSGVLLNDAMSF